MKSENFSGSAVEKIETNYSVYFTGDEPSPDTNRQILYQTLLGSLPKESMSSDRVLWSGTVEDFFTCFVVMANVDWTEVAGWAEITRENLKRIRTNPSNQAWYIQKSFLQNFFSNVPLKHIFVVHLALKSEKRQDIYELLPQLGICEKDGTKFKQSGFMNWGPENHQKLLAFLNQNKIAMTTVAPVQFYKSICRMADQLPRRIQNLRLLRLAWNIKRAVDSSHITRAAIEKQLQGNALIIFDYLTEKFWTNGLLPRRLDWLGHVRDGILQLREKLSIPSIHITKALGYYDHIHLDKNKSKSVQIDIVRLISFSKHFDQHLDLAQTISKISKPKLPETFAESASATSEKQKKKSPKKWSAVDEEICRRRAGENCSAAIIAEELTRTRGSVVGFCSRNNIQLHGNEDGAQVRKSTKRAALKSHTPKSLAAPKDKTRKPNTKPVNKGFPDALSLFCGTGKILLRDAREFECHWPLDDKGKGVTACGDDVYKNGASRQKAKYCLRHFNMSHGRH